jgi:hypothetical protein
MSDGLQYRIHFISPAGLLLISTEFTDNREKIVYLADVFNVSVKGIRASVETKAIGYVKVPQAINLG